MNNYRVTFGGDKIDYYDNFDECRRYMGLIVNIFDILKEYKVKYYWYFFEPYVEITWLGENASSLKKVQQYLDQEEINYQYSESSDGVTFADWYYESKLEKMFGCIRYSLCSQQALLFYFYDKSINQGKGLENHYMRSCHVLANQLAMNYKDEGKALLKRGILCMLFWWLGHKKAVWIYTKILRQKY